MPFASGKSVLSAAKSSFGKMMRKQRQPKEIVYAVNGELIVLNARLCAQR